MRPVGLIGAARGSRVHPDEMVRRCFWAPAARIPPATRIATTVRRCAARCANPSCESTTWALKTSTGKGRNKRKLAEPLAICVVCKHAWEVWDEVLHTPNGVANGAVTQRGRWTRFIHIRNQRIAAGDSTEERLFGDVDLWALQRLRAIAQRLYRSERWYWQAHAYFPYALHFGAVRGRGGERALARWAERGWPNAPFAWNQDRVQRLIEEGRAEWARRLVAGRLIDGGDWWEESGISR